MKMRLRFGTILVASVIVVAGTVRAEEPLARFGVISDVHILPSDKHRSDVMRDALKYLDSRKVDGVVACGDLTQNGTIS